MARTLLSWSSGKDSAWTLHVLRRRPDIELAGLVTTVNREADRVAMHAVRRQLVGLQADAAGLPVDFIPLPFPCSNAEYEGAFREYLLAARRRGVEQIAFGDLFLEDVRRYREALLHGSGVTPSFPIFGTPTDSLARSMVRAGVKATITCVDPTQLPAEFAGRQFDVDFLEALPPGVDPCGENGEFHTFVTEGPMFTHEVAVTVGETVERDGFVFTDLLAAARKEGDD